MLDEGRNDMKPIYVVNRAQSSDVNGWRQIASPKPPFYTLGIISAIYCNKMFHLDVNHKFNLSVENINGHTGDCDSSKIPPPDEVYSGLLNHLEFRGLQYAVLATKRHVIRLCGRYSAFSTASRFIRYMILSELLIVSFEQMVKYSLKLCSNCS